jgi:SAM-dependent methyltransferase
MNSAQRVDGGLAVNTQAMDPHGQALLDFFHGDASATVLVHRDDGVVDELPARVFFREPAEFSPIEKAALARCRGRVLDIGAGTGCHSLALQERGLEVLAIDVAPQAVEIMSKRGVEDARLADVFAFHGGPFDTLLMMMHGIGLVQDLAGLDRFLAHARTLLKPGGQILLDSLDVRCTQDPRHLAYQQANRQAGRYFGEIRLRFEYKGRMGPSFGWLHVDAVTLEEHAGRAGWSCEVMRREESGDYLARLAPEELAGIPYTAVPGAALCPVGCGLLTAAGHYYRHPAPLAAWESRATRGLGATTPSIADSRVGRVSRPGS